MQQPQPEQPAATPEPVRLPKGCAVRGGNPSVLSYGSGHSLFVPGQVHLNLDGDGDAFGAFLMLDVAQAIELARQLLQRAEHVRAANEAFVAAAAPPPAA